MQHNEPIHINGLSYHCTALLIFSSVSRCLLSFLLIPFAWSVWLADMLSCFATPFLMVTSALPVPLMD